MMDDAQLIEFENYIDRLQASIEHADERNNYTVYLGHDAAGKIVEYSREMIDLCRRVNQIVIVQPKITPILPAVGEPW